VSVREITIDELKSALSGGAQVIDALHHNHNYEKIVCYSKISEQDKYNKAGT
jgi:hypothetical protein